MAFEIKLTEKRRFVLETLKLENEFELLNYFPFRYDDFSINDITALDHDKQVVVKGEVINKSGLLRINARLQKFTFQVADNNGVYKGIVFNRAFMYKNIVIGEKVLVRGKYNHFKKEIAVIDLFTKDIDSFLIRPKYNLKEKVHNYEVKNLVMLAYRYLVKMNMLDEIIPLNFSKRYRLISRKSAYYYIHFPNNKNELVQALRYLKYEEFLIFSLMMQKLKLNKKEIIDSKNKKTKLDYIQKFINNLPFMLTISQEKAFKEISSDMENNYLMYRLLQGDVGSGKTVVASLALALNFSSGYQGAFMAPTEILATQHYEVLKTFFGFDKSINIALLTGSMSEKEKRQIHEELENHKIDIIVGTHALFQKNVVFKKLGLVVIDEQHRFGVIQRKMLREKGSEVEMLMMSATPIPRTLAMSLFGDMDVSTLDTFPSAKRKVETIVIKEDQIQELYNKIIEASFHKVATFIVCPLIEEDDNRKSVNEVYEDLKKRLKDKSSIAMLHGKMASQEKNEIIENFKNGEIQILVSTTVIEVGIDIKHADNIVIFDANNFGLAQLHQLRGRVGRRGQQAYCYLVLENENEEALKRLTFLVENDDGFEVARFDLENRGQGDLAGIRQSGVYDFQIASIFQDLNILEVAREDAKIILENKDDEENKKIIDYLDTVMAKNIAITD